MIMNFKNLFRITYNRPYNPYKSYPKNANRNVAVRTAWGEENARIALREIKSNGYKIISIRNGIGNLVTL